MQLSFGARVPCVIADGSGLHSWLTAAEEGAAAAVLLGRFRGSAWPSTHARGVGEGGGGCASVDAGSYTHG